MSPINESYLVRHVSNHLQTAIFNERSFCCTNEALKEQLAPCIPTLIPLLTPYTKKTAPQLVAVNTHYLFAIVDLDISYIVGPFYIEYSNHLVRECKSELSFPRHQDIPLHTLDVITEQLLLLYNVFHPFELTVEDVLHQNLRMASDISQIKTTQLLFQNQEELTHHNPYQQEIREMHSIEQGDLMRLKKSWEETYTGKVGRLALDDLRHTKNIAIVLITLASRAAMRGGALPEICYSMSDGFIQTVEQFETTDEILAYARQTEIEYTLLVNRTKRQHHLQNKDVVDVLHPYVSKTMEYISQHLHKAITVQELANSVPCSVTYLSALYQKEVKKSIQEYITQEKMNYAEQLLIYSPHSISAIASILGYASQSYFGKVFKHITNYTPKQYRKKFGRI